MGLFCCILLLLYRPLWRLWDGGRFPHAGFLVMFVLNFLLPMTSSAQHFKRYWKNSFKAFDLVTDSLEQSSGSVNRRQELWVEELYCLARQYSHVEVAQWRALYWDAVTKSDRKNLQEAIRLINLAERKVDRRAFFYDYRRIVRSRVIFENTKESNMYRLYVQQLEDIDYFGGINDRKTLAGCYLVMGNIFLNLNEYVPALDYFMKARRLYREEGFATLDNAAEMDIALCHIGQGHALKALAILNRLEGNSLAVQDTAFHIHVLLNISYCYGQRGKLCPLRYMKMMKQLSEQFGNDYLRELCRINFGSWLYRNKRYDEAIACLQTVRRYAEKNRVTAWFPKFYKGIVECYYEKHQNDSVAKYYRLYIQSVDSLEASGMKFKIMREDELRKIRQFNEEKRTEQEQMRMRFLTVLQMSALALVFLAGVCVLLWYRSKKAKIQLEGKRLESERRRLEIERQNRQLITSAMAVENSDKTLRSIRSQIGEACTKNEIDSSIAYKLDSQLKVHLDTDNGWNAFKETFEKVYPAFFTRLGDSHPSLTEYDIRLCAYLVAGMDRKQIATMLNVLPDSLKKSCQRLRKKLEIAQGASLTNYLQSFNRPET